MSIEETIDVDDPVRMPAEIKVAGVVHVLMGCFTALLAAALLLGGAWIFDEAPRLSMAAGIVAAILLLSTTVGLTLGVGLLRGSFLAWVFAVGLALVGMLSSIGQVFRDDGAAAMALGLGLNLLTLVLLMGPRARSYFRERRARKNARVAAR